ncbi:RNA pyrophosphohydrolase [Candidatus Palibaumannia cicadellinicola]|uniref:RNA pyrophosphohydrolase n=1 Tax=Baumannia cicadellinicola subsp. Homalodisca coagulata TaxID=374463 RepID=RPPH_BAUCH|nr:RNA pyrophosphohydrolase [Candidatus Baumannia cicadellinicola]Q1LSU2.1 RecName: Full=RNA pyrophosphohydrolase; AltName: Full=(Di)nucleoside polyphosphate hydrolase [Baumannia cicadellinicola str. Hc (Homalodisca coagulata)]ABF13947.1 (Di)nucleoside polyphosphate hydrolase [Baumannia cicadellinicola str. Hc (Homalodisca coagulata)]MCJ7462166.1 RNA pyrophosphohydrolase [Candidatus Baumannia cicadellinicola]MCJ7463008.1 RNA pyrophosphohydrolase [Candidatus Baumannia cicadellinicola]
MINEYGYRPNVGIVIGNFNGQVLWARRYKQNAWQFPQGGINSGETAEQAMFRELFEEVGLRPKDVRILTTTRYWLKYKIPHQFIRWDAKPICIGQKQKWFLLQLVCKDTRINIQCGKKPEFDSWKWVSFWYPLSQVVFFKRNVYRRMMKEFSRAIMLPE